MTFKCPCGMELLSPKAVDLIRVEPKLDDIMLCGVCGKPSKVTLEGLVYLTDSEFKSLQAQEMSDLIFAQRAVQRQLRNNGQ